MIDNLSKTSKNLRKCLVIFRRDAFEIKKALTEEGFELVDENPDFVICYGGDGTVLYGERNFPGLPKLIIKTSRTCRMYDYGLKDLCVLLSKIKDGDYQIHSEMKLEVQAKGTRLVGLNEIQVHIKLPIYAVRFLLAVDSQVFKDLIGDGVIVATPFGSTGYYEATGGQCFEKGIGISFNNLHRKKLKSIIVSEDSVIHLSINRGPALLVVDNNEKFIELNAGDEVSISKSVGVANFIYFSSL
jgi:NAD+ kinase